MILLREIELFVLRIFGKSFHYSIWQVNKTTIRIELIKGVFIDIFQSVRDQTKFALHAKISEFIFRVDCRPERKYIKLKSFPWHFHKKTEENVETSPFSINKRTALAQFLRFVKKTLKEEKKITE